MHSWKLAKDGIRYHWFMPLPPVEPVGHPYSVGVATLGLSGWLLHVRSNSGIRTIWPSYARRALSTPDELVFPVWGTHCQDGSGIAGLLGVWIDWISFWVPPPGGFQLSHPTLPGPFLHSGTR